jgi:F0F1-type ATP synthase membrane subunit b/b'
VEHQFNFLSAVGIPYFNFFVFVAAFVIFFRKPLIKMVAARREAFISASKEAAQALTDARKVFDEVKNRFDSLEQELSDFAKQSEKMAHDEAARMLSETERFTAQLKEETGRLAKDAIERARFELRQELVTVAKALAASRIEKELDGAAKAKILKAQINAAASMNLQ